MRRRLKWVSKAAVLAIHERLLAEHGGASGMVDEGSLESALAAPLNHHSYGEDDPIRLAASYAFTITQNHPFVDANKRVSLTVAGVFLGINGWRLDATEQDAANATLALSSRRMTELEFAEWLRTNAKRANRHASRQPKKRR